MSLKRLINKLREKYYWRGHPEYEDFKAEPKHLGKFCYVRIGIVPVEAVVKHIGQRRRFLGIKLPRRRKFFGVRVSMSSKRVRCFADNHNCIACGREGHYFAVEKCKNVETEKYHLNLYCRTKRNREIMLTIDHRIPKSKGGSNKLKNLQTMCSPCNHSKSDKMIFVARKPKCEWKEKTGE